MNKRLFAVIGATFAIGLSAGAARAGTTAYSSVAAYDGATTGLTSGDFSSVPTPFSDGTDPGTFGSYNPLSGYSSLAGVSFSTPNLDGAVNVDSAFFYGPSDLPAPYAVNSVYSGSAADILDITLPSAVTAFGLDFTTLFASTTASFTLDNGYTTAVTPTAIFPNTPEFLGFTSTTPFSTIVFSVPNGFSWVVADFNYGSAAATSAVPEPSSWAIMLAGFAAIGVYARRRPGLLRAFPNRFEASPAG